MKLATKIRFHYVLMVALVLLVSILGHRKVTDIGEVFMNLVVNAGHAITEKGTIIISTTATSNEVTIEIADDGKGIAPEHLPRTFEPFFTTKPIGQGNGLGLSLSYGIVLKHQGRIDVDSAPGQGTRFRIHLPIRQGRPQLAAASTAPPS